MQHPESRKIVRVVALLVSLLLVATSCTNSDNDDNNDEQSASEESTRLGGTSGEGPATSDELGIRLSDGTPASVAPISLVTGSALSDQEVAAVLDRLPEWDIPLQQPTFNRPAQTLTPPLVGDTIAAAFPPEGAQTNPGATETDQLEVIRFQPEGDVTIAPYLSLTFNEPMIPLATLEQLDEQDIPVQMTPSVPGRWRWIGTRTLRFEVEPGATDRLPMATDFTVTVPAGTEAESGHTLANDFSWTFSTPPAVTESLYPESESLPTTQVFVATFDQIVDPETVLAKLTLTADGDSKPVRLATASEIERDDAVASMLDQSLDDRVVAFRATNPLPADADLIIEFGVGTPSAEGPKLTTEPTKFTARTFAPLRVVGSSCDYGNGCEPLTPWTIQFNNPLDLDKFSKTSIDISPELPGVSINVYGDTIQISGASKGQTDYTVTIDQGITDTFGQSMTEDKKVTFKVGKASPTLRGFDRQFVTLDPLADQAGISVTTVNHDSVRVAAWSVKPSQSADFVRYVETFWNDPENAEPPFSKVFDEIVDIDRVEDAAVETFVSLDQPLSESNQLVVLIESTLDIPRDSERYWQNQPTIAWVQSTNVGVDAVVSNKELLVWTTDLSTGEPLPQASVQVLGQNKSITTDDDGLATVSLGAGKVTGLVATVGDDTGMLPSNWYQGWEQSNRSDESRWYIFDDRGVYKPEETVRLKGWVKRFTSSTNYQLGAIGDSATVRYQVYDPQGIELTNGTTELNGLGGFNIEFLLPAGVNLGQGYVYFELVGAAGLQYQGADHTFSIQEFRTPEFEVSAHHESPAPYYANDAAVIAADASYYAGGPLANADVEWTVRSKTTTYTPPNRSDFSFGIWQPWWIYGGYGGFYESEPYYGDYECWEDCGGFGDDKVERFAGTTDASGSHYLRMDFEGPEIDQPTSVTAEATVFDVNRQAWSATTNVLVHPAHFYVGIRSDRPFVEKNTPLRIEAIVTDIDGAAVADRDVVIEAGRLTSSYIDGVWTEEVVDAQTCTVASETEAVTCEFETPIGGTYQVTAVVIDDDGQSNRSQMTRWVSGGTSVPTRNIELEAVTLVPDADEYAPGDTAEVLVQAPFSPATGLMTVTRGGIESTEVFDAPDGTAIVQIPIADDDIPGLTVRIDMVGAAERTTDDGTPLPELPARPAYAQGLISLSIPPVSRTLSIEVVPDAAQLEPGDDTSVTVSVTNPDGAAVSGADVAIVVVDEAVLSLTGYQLADPLATFYRPLYDEVWTEAIRASIVLNRSDLVSAAGEDELTAATEESANTATTEASAGEPSPDGGGASDDSAESEDNAVRSAADSEGGGAKTIDVRADFSALAVYSPDESTDANGSVTVAVPLPDNLTRYRVMAVAVNGDDQFGKGEATITARLPLMVRPSAPRFLNFGDQFELPIVVQNQTDEPMIVDVAVEEANLTLSDMAGKRVTVPANDRIEVRFPMTTDQVGTGRFRVAAVSGADADSAEVDLPVYTPSTAEAFATYGVVDEGAIAQPIASPTGVFPQFGGLEIDTSSTALQALTDAVLYLHEYRYESADGLATRIIAVASLRDVLDAFDADGLPDTATLNANVQRDIAELVKLQNDDGGFSWWRRGDISQPFVSITAADAFVAAKAAGYTVPSSAMASALAYLTEIERHFPAYYSQEVRDSMSAYALYVRHSAGDTDSAKALALYKRASDTLQLDALAWLWPVIDDTNTDAAIERIFQNRATETAGAATFATDYGEDAYLIAHSDRQTDGVILNSLITERPDSDLIPKVVAGLLGNQIRGRWNNAYENSFILRAMSNYFETFESVDPDFVARIWLGDTYAGAHVYNGRTTDRGSTTIPMADLVATDGETDVIVSKDGPGRLYYRLGLRYAPDDLTLAARDEGFVVDRVYEAVNDDDDVRLDADGTWHIAAGATVRIKVTMVADARRTNMALLDPLPAGLEPLNPDLATSSMPLPDDGPAARGSSWCWCWRWYEHQNLRDDRAEAFTSYLNAGTYEFVYTARATTPGTFVVPPARAEEIYAPEVFGRSASAIVIIE